MNEENVVAGHAFISYAHANSRKVDQLQRSLEAAGIRVWRDKTDLSPGEDWSARIRVAITQNALVFIACFSRQSTARMTSYQNEELTLAIEEMRKRPPGDPWLIPVRLDDCEIPYRDIGGGRTLDSIQRADLFGPGAKARAEKLVAAVLKILGQDSIKTGAAESLGPPALAYKAVRTGSAAGQSSRTVSELTASARPVRNQAEGNTDRKDLPQRDQVPDIRDAYPRRKGASDARLRTASPGDPAGQVTDTGELGAILPASDVPIEVIENSVDGFDQQLGSGVSVSEYLLARFPRVLPFLSGGQPGESSAEVFTEFFAVLLTIFDTGSASITSPAMERSYEEYYLEMAASAVEGGSWREIRMSAFLRDLRSGIRPGEAIRRHLRTENTALIRFLDTRCDQEPELVSVFQAVLEELVQLARRAASVEEGYRRSIAARNFEEAKAAFEVLASQDTVRAHQLRQETGFIWLDDPDRDVMAGLWSRLAVGNSARPEIRVLPRALSTLASDTADPAGSATVADTSRRAPTISPAAVASRRDYDPAGLLRDLFCLPDEQASDLAGRLISGRRGRAGPVEFRAAHAGTLRSSCHVLCFNASKPLSITTLAPDVARREQRLAEDGVDYLIVLSLRSEIDDELQNLAADWDRQEKYPFAVRLFGITALREAAEQPEIIGATLLPRPRVTREWARYLRNPALLTFPGEEHPPLDSTYHNQLPVRFADDKGTPMAGTAFDQVQSWLNGDRQGLVVLGDFGDGKTFFTYSLARRLCEASQATPANTRVPLRLALKDLAAAGSAHELLRRRLGDLGMYVADWQLLVNTYSTLVILDGFDEMSTELSQERMLENIKLLRGCFQLFTSSKILLTSRDRAFGPPADQERLFDRIGNPGIVRLRRIERAEVKASLLAAAQDPGQRQTVNRLFRLHDPIGLATKPLYHEMIRDTLPNLPQEDFTEETLYETYVSRTLQRKLDYLEDEHLRVKRGIIVGNLLSILERVATELHRSNAPYLYLKDLDLRGLAFDGNHGLAHVLWQTREGAGRASEDASDEDATARVGIRSLLKGHPDGEPERWPVDFCHRSMREYFAARAIANAVVAGPADLPPLLTQTRLPQEILRFTTLILRPGADDSIPERLERWARSVDVEDEPSPLGSNALSLLYAYLGEVPGLDWSGLYLDYAQLPGADLRARSFRRSSLRHANLDNVNLTQADLSDADLSGVRLEETAAVTAIAAGPGDAIYVAYADKTLRRCDIRATRVTDQVLQTLPHRIDRLWLTPQQRLVAVGDSSLTLLSNADGHWQPRAHFRLQSRYHLPDYAAPMALLADEAASVSGRLVWFDPTTDTGSYVNLPGALIWSVLGIQGYVAAAPGDVLADLGNAQVKWAEEMASAVALRIDSPHKALVAIGRQDGVVQLIRLARINGGIRRTQDWTHLLHAGPVTAIAFLGTDRIVTGGADRRLCVLPAALSGGSDHSEVISFELTLRCHGICVDRMRGIHEQNLLRQLANR